VAVADPGADVTGVGPDADGRLVDDETTGRVPAAVGRDEVSRASSSPKRARAAITATASMAAATPTVSTRRRELAATSIRARA
jgi:hypothetical protein